MFLCNQRYTHNKNPLKKFNSWESPWHAAELYTAAHSAPSQAGWGRKIRRAKVEKPMCWDEDILVIKMGKKLHKSTMQKTINYHQLTNIQPVFKQWQPLGNILLQFYLWLWYYMVSAFGQFGSTVPAVYPPSLLSAPNMLVGREGETEKALALGTHCLAITKALVSVNTLLITSTNSMWLTPHILLWKKLTPSWLDPVHSCSAIRLQLKSVLGSNLDSALYRNLKSCQSSCLWLGKFLVMHMPTS